MSNRPTKETGGNIVGSIVGFVAALKPKGPLFTLSLGKYNVENLVENEDQTEAQAIGKNCWFLSLPQGFSCAYH